MKPTESLIEEHRLIFMVREAAEREATRIEATAEVNHYHLEQLLDFFRNSADACHHRKEEVHLFKLLERTPPLRGPVAVVLQEHEMGRGILRRVQEGLGAGESWGSRAGGGGPAELRGALAGAHRQGEPAAVSHGR